MDHLTTDGPMVVLGLLEFAAGLVFAGDSSFQAALAMAAEAGQHFDAVHGCDKAPLYPAIIEGFAALQTTVYVHPHGFKRAQIEAA
jgi:hypothetical protein